MVGGVRVSGLKRSRAPSQMSKRKRQNTRGRVVPTATFSVPRLRNYSLGGNRKVTMIYHERFSVNPAAGLTGAYIFRANTCYDPNVTGAGHQPRGFDQLMALYDHGTVIGSKIDVGVFNTNATAVTAAVSLRDEGTPSVTYDDILEVATCSWTIVSSLTASGVANLTQTCSPKNFLGRPNLMSEDDLRFSRSNDCTEQAFYHVYFGPTDGGFDLGAVHCHVRIEYTVILSEPRLPSSS